MTMTHPSNPVIPLHRLSSSLEHVRQAIAAELAMATDDSGNMLALTPPDGERRAVALAALAAGNLAAVEELQRLSGMSPKDDDPQTLIVEGSQGCLILCRGITGLIFIVKLRADGVLGMARLEMRQLAKTVWKAVQLDSGERNGLAADLAQKILESIDTEL